MRKTTLASLAREANCSISAVSVALNGTSGTTSVSDELRDRLQKLARKRNYRPNASARSVRSGQSHHIALVAQASRNMMSFGVAQDYVVAISRMLGLHGYSVSPIPFVSPAEFAQHRLLRERLIDAAVAVSAAPEMDGLEEHFEICVWADHNHFEPTRCVRPDEVAAGRLAVERLADLGYRKVLYVTRSQQSHFSGPQRLEGARAAAAARGVELETIALPWPFSTSGMALPRDGSTAILAFDQSMAWRVALLAGMTGVRLGVDFGLASCDSQGSGSTGWPELTQVLTPRERVASVAVDMIRQLIEQPGSSCPSQIVPVDWKPGSTAPGPAG